MQNTMSCAGKSILFAYIAIEIDVFFIYNENYNQKTLNKKDWRAINYENYRS